MHKIQADPEAIVGKHKYIFFCKMSRIMLKKVRKVKEHKEHKDPKLESENGQQYKTCQ